MRQNIVDLSFWNIRRLVFCNRFTCTELLVLSKKLLDGSVFYVSLNSFILVPMQDVFVEWFVGECFWMSFMSFRNDCFATLAMFRFFCLSLDALPRSLGFGVFEFFDLFYLVLGAGCLLRDHLGSLHSFPEWLLPVHQTRGLLLFLYVSFIVSLAARFGESSIPCLRFLLR